MNNKIKRLTIISTAIILLSLFFVAFTFQRESKDFRLVKNLDIYYSLFRELNTFYVDEIDPDKLVKSSIDNMLKTLDPYTVYIPESQQDEFRFITTGKYGGVGSLIRKSGDYVVLSNIYEDFPADRANLKTGDILKEIDGKSIKGLPVDQVSERLKGEAGTSVSIVIERNGKDIQKEIVRKGVKIPPVPYYGKLDSQTGYIRFTSFTEGCSKDVKKALLDLIDSQGASKIILDLRNNPGGLLPEAVEIVNLFVGQGQLVVRTKGKVNQFDHSYKTTHQAVDENIPLVVIINRNSASASEIVAGAIQDLDRGVIVGQRSYGKGLVQISRPLSYNTSLKVTTAKYYIPSGRCIQALDYSHRNEDGSVGHVPDSLISEFQTQAGRIVKDGGGIIPDYSVDVPQLSQLATELFFGQYIFDYATLYTWKNETLPEPGQFVFPEEEYNNFLSYVKERGFKYERATQGALRQLVDVAHSEKLYEDNKALFDSLKVKLKPDLDADFARFRDEISQLLEDELVNRYYYDRGQIKNSLSRDTQVKKALEVIKDQKIYSSTLSGESGSLSTESAEPPFPERVKISAQKPAYGGTEKISG